MRDFCPSQVTKEVVFELFWLCKINRRTEQPTNWYMFSMKKEAAWFMTVAGLGNSWSLIINSLWLSGQYVHLGNHGTWFWFQVQTETDSNDQSKWNRLLSLGPVPSSRLQNFRDIDKWSSLTLHFSNRGRMCSQGGWNSTLIPPIKAILIFATKYNTNKPFKLFHLNCYGVLDINTDGIQ